MVRCSCHAVLSYVVLPTTLDYYNLENGSVSEVAYYNTSHCAVTFIIDIQKVCVYT